MRGGQRKKILCVEDDPIMQLMLKDVVGTVGADCVVVGTTQEAEERLNADRFDLTLLDRQLPDSDGLLLLQTIKKTSGCPVVVLSGMGETRDKILGIGLGAIEYLTKPVNPLELCGRIKNILTSTARVEQKERSEDFECADLCFNTQTRQLKAGKKTHFLAPSEAKLLQVFIAHEGDVLHRDQLYEAACSREWTPGDRTIDVLVSRLRRKLSGSSAEIVTVHGVGYLLVLKK
ncbi:MAG: response regulator transcription factor [Thalassovita sp.]